MHKINDKIPIEKKIIFFIYRPNHLDVNFIIPSGKDPATVEEHDVVRIFVSFDFGWSKRGNGRQYDSKNGYGALIGYKTGLIPDVQTMNVDCKSCKLNIPISAHDCRKNFDGTSKAMAKLKQLQDLWYTVVF